MFNFKVIPRWSIKGFLKTEDSLRYKKIKEEHGCIYKNL